MTRPLFSATLIAALCAGTLSAQDSGGTATPGTKVPPAATAKQPANPEAAPAVVPAPTVVADPATDPAVEAAYWQAIQASDDPMVFVDYLDRYPEGAFRVLARDRIEALWQRALDAFALLEEMGVPLDGAGIEAPAAAPAAVAPVPVPAPAPVAPPVVAGQPKPAAPALTLDELTKRSQRQLKRLGCYAGRADGIWGPASRAAMRRFNAGAGTSFAAYKPTEKALDHMRDLAASGARVCP